MKRVILWALAAAATLAIAGAAFAQAADPEDSATPIGPGDRFVGHLAERLGLPEDQVRQALRDAAKDTVDDAVANGKLTEEQAERAKARIDEGGLPFGGAMGKHHGRLHGAVKATIIDAAAEAIGVTPDELRAALRDGKDIGDVAAERGVSLDTVRSAVRAAVREGLQPQVDSGRISAERADEIADRVAGRIGD